MKATIETTEETRGRAGVTRYQVEWKATDQMFGWQAIRPIVDHERQALGLLAAQVDMDGGLARARRYRIKEITERVVLEQDGAEVLGEVPAPPYPFDPVRSCRVCGCTEDRACPGGCSWVGPNLCSKCAVRTTTGKEMVNRQAPIANHQVKAEGRRAVKRPVRRWQRRNGGESVAAVVERVVPTCTRAFNVGDLLELVRKEGAPKANKWAVQKALENCVVKGIAVRVERGVYEKAGRPKHRRSSSVPQGGTTEDRGTEDAKGKAKEPKADRSESYSDPEVRMKILHTRAAEVVRDGFAPADRFTRESFANALRIDEPELVTALEEGELGGVLRALQAEGKIKLAIAPGPGQVAVYEKV